MHGVLVKTVTKAIIGGGVGLGLWWFLTRTPANPQGNVTGTTVIKTTGECAPGGSAYGGAGCVATGSGSSTADSIVDSFANAVESAANALTGLFSDVRGAPTGTGAGKNDYVDNDAESYESAPPFVAPNVAGRLQGRLGGDGGETAKLQLVGLGSRIDDTYTKNALATPALVNHR